MKVFDEKTGHYYYIYDGEEMITEKAELTVFGIDEGQLYDCWHGGIPNWSKHYKGKKNNKVENDNI
ncbi:MAG: hypothetical protein LUG12_01675 [Erysipelotrichaceae bacterium]|nr:hypothetical protein [Erysipelotrichaceae bacterium]